MVAPIDSVLDTDEDGESVSIVPDDVVEAGPGDVVASVGIVVTFVSCVNSD